MHIIFSATCNGGGNSHNLFIYFMCYFLSGSAFSNIRFSTRKTRGREEA